MASALPNVGKGARYGDLKRRLFFLLAALVVFRIGAHIPCPGIDPNVLADLFQGQQGGILGMFNMFSGGALSRFTIFALGIMPYISASIIMQLMTAVSPQLDQLRKEGEAGRRKITQYTRYGTVFLALFQATGISIALESQPGLVLDPGLMFRITTVTSLVTGTMFLMWLGEQITERGIGNGISLIIFAGIAAGLPAAIAGTLELVRTGAMHPLTALLIAVAVLVVTAFVCFVERGQRKILVNYAKRQVGNRVYGGQSSHLPFKLNMSGVIPPIFASSLLLFPGTVTGFIDHPWAVAVQQYLAPGTWLYTLTYVGLIIFFCYFYTAVTFNPTDVAENMKKFGGFIPGIRPGQRTAEYIDRVLSRITLVGAIYIAAVCILPTILRPMSMEAAAGKNPVTHVGKLYSLLASRIAAALVTELSEVKGAECVLVSGIGRPVSDPHLADLRLRLAEGSDLSAVRPRAEEIVARTAQDPVALAGLISAQVREIDPSQPVAEVRDLHNSADILGYDICPTARELGDHLKNIHKRV